MFCYGMLADGMFDVQHLTLLTQRDWFTVFRYERPGQSPWIIKCVALARVTCLSLVADRVCRHTSVNSVTFKYLLQEKVMFSYLQHAGIANEIVEYRDFHPLVMFTDLDPSTNSDNPFTGNDRFVVYEDGGRPIDIHLETGWRPSRSVVRQIARQLVEVLAYLSSKQVVHRKLGLGSVVLNVVTKEVKLISLGAAKYIGSLDYESTVTDFARDWQALSVDRTQARGDSHSRNHSPTPQPNLSNVPDPTGRDDCTHPETRCDLQRVCDCCSAA